MGYTEEQSFEILDEVKIQKLQNDTILNVTNSFPRADECVS